MKIALIETGGTINGILDTREPEAPRSRVAAWWRQHHEYSALLGTETVIAMKDSRAITEHDRAALVRAIGACSERAVIVPHGTFTMPDTGRYLLRNVSSQMLARTIILVGSLIPLEDPQSDAPANLELALAAAVADKPGVWLSMGGKLWHPERVRKDPVSGQFVAA